MQLKPVLVMLVAIALIALGVWQLEGHKNGLSIHTDHVGTTPVTYYAPQSAAPAPLVVIAHGFAGSRALMESYALALAQAGYLVASFDFEGHGRNPTPMSGDVEAIEGTTQLLVDETLRVVEAGLTQVGTNGSAALLGHSMASDIIVRAASRDARIAAVVAISPFSDAITATHPDKLLMITGAWEPRLRAFALDAARMVEPTASENESVQSTDVAAELQVMRQAFVAPNVEHVGVLYSRPGIEAARTWLNAAFERPQETDSAAVPLRIGWIFLVLTGTVLLVWPLAQWLPYRASSHQGLSSKGLLLALALPMLLAPALASVLPTGFLPVLVADYLAVHMALYGIVQLLILRVLGQRMLGNGLLGLQLSGFAIAAGMLVAAYGVLVFGFALDRYVANFLPHAGRLPIIAALAVGAVPFMIADSTMAHAHPKFWQRMLIRLAFLVSLGIAIALDFEGLFFLILIIPVIALFFLIFGLMGRWVEARAGPLASGLGLGLLLAWSLGVTFPMFV
ncbi:MAG: alpha/beta fold hydrolase [Devosiaceae bacterium]